MRYALVKQRCRQLCARILFGISKALILSSGDMFRSSFRLEMRTANHFEMSGGQASGGKGTFLSIKRPGPPLLNGLKINQRSKN
jgi:hypothetical protein